MKIDWKRKLTSRKWWINVVTFIAGLVMAFGFNDNTVTMISGCLMSLAAAIAYTIGEGFTDVASIKANADVERSTQTGKSIVELANAIPKMTKNEEEGQNDKQEH